MSKTKIANKRTTQARKKSTVKAVPKAVAHSHGAPRTDAIQIQGARQNNLSGFDLTLPLGELIVVTGVSGSGKSSLAFDTVYSEGQRRYVETFSPYARQFLDRMDKPAVDRIDGIPPSIAIDQTNPVRTSRSTVGTMTELNDHLKLLFARAATLYCSRCANPVRQDTPHSIAQALFDGSNARETDWRAAVTFDVTVPKNFSEEEVRQYLDRQGYARVLGRSGARLTVVQDRLRVARGRSDRLSEALEAALERGQGRIAVYPLDDKGEAIAGAEPLRFSTKLHCASCDRDYRAPAPHRFSFNSPLGACETCRGFGRTMGIDYALVVPDETKSIAGGAVKPFQSDSYSQCQRDLLAHARARGLDVKKPWSRLSKSDRNWVLQGDGAGRKNRRKIWYGAKGFFDWLETKSYRMHVRVLLSRYRSYDQCDACNGARLQPEALLWRVGTLDDANRALGSTARFRPRDLEMDDTSFERLPGLNFHDAMRLPLERARSFFDALTLPAPLDQADELLLGEIRSRLRYLNEVGLGYLTLDRQSRSLSGGEVQRINLTTALGTSLVNTLFVLDEPSIGLHARDMDRLVQVLHRLRDAGNTLLVVEHDAQVMRSADRIIDIGPGPGEHGGKIVFEGTPAALLRSKRSLTARYLSGKASVTAGLERSAKARAVKRSDPCIEVRGAAEHNLKSIDVRLPLNRLVCVTGVSGSGKSTLVQDILYAGLRKQLGRPVDPPGRHESLAGFEHIDDVVMVDQSPIGKTTRSNPASYVGVLDAIRKLFVAEPLSVERGYTPGTFSFNAGAGRCPTCGGNGFEHVEMQFLSDVYLRCADCDGRRYRPEVLEVKIAPLGAGDVSAPCSIADVLDMTAEQAGRFFAGHGEVQRSLEPLVAVGLGYMRLGQPVTTLSGGEAQRLKLAGHLAKNAGARAKRAKRNAAPAAGTLFLFDEPTTGLHFDDIATLLRAFERLVMEGHSLIVVEHNLDVVAAADWIVDLGPEGGDAGGELVTEGTPAKVIACVRSHTGRLLARHYDEQRRAANGANGAGNKKLVSKKKRAARGNDEFIRIHNAREHNLKNIDVNVPRKGFTVITGISGSGKSTVAFDILFAEGQRRYLESLNAYARQFVQPASRPDVDAIFGIPPTVAIEQRTSRGGRKSTVATMTELYHFLRLLFVKLGTQYCPDCDVAIEPQSVDAIVARLFARYRGKTVTLLSPLVVARKGYYTDLAKWAGAKGYAHLRVDGALQPTDNWPRLDRFKEHDIELPVDTLQVEPKAETALRAALGTALGFGKGVVQVLPAGRGGRATVFSTQRACPGCGRSFKELDPRLFSFNSKHGWCTTCFGTGVQLEDFDEEQTGEERWWTPGSDDEDVSCPACDGTRLRPEASSVRLKGLNIGAYTARSVSESARQFDRYKLAGRAALIARDVLAEVRSRLAFLERVGLGYLTLDRAAPTLSGGEAQRIRLAAQLGSNLRGVCYVLDEPTIGLHTRDNRMLLDTLKHLERAGNTVVVVEHDEDTIRAATHVIDLGPRAGRNGGHVMAEGTLDAVMRNSDSLTGRFLANPLRHPIATDDGAHRVAEDVDHGRIVLRGANAHNLRSVDVSLPLGKLVCVSGVSGSGKSTLTRTVLHDNLKRMLERKPGRKRAFAPRGCTALEGAEPVQRVLEVDQTPIGKTPRSCPATYVGIFDPIRKLFAQMPEASLRGYGPARFSFNVKGGRCDACDGQGYEKVEMSFLPDVRVSCEVCAGDRFNSETLAVRYKDRTIAEVLAMSVDEAVMFFDAHRQVRHTLGLLRDVGLGYLTLGQQSPTLSGGEAQRIKLVTELAKARSTLDAPANGAGPRGGRRASVEPHTLYVLDEPTIGLHMADVEKLIRVLHRLVATGNSVIVIEHNLDVIAEAHWVLDMGPEGGDGGGRVVAAGAPHEIVRKPGRSYTARYLGEFLSERSPGRAAC